MQELWWYAQKPHLLFGRLKGYWFSSCLSISISWNTLERTAKQPKSKQNQIGLLICFWVDLNGSLSLSLFLNFIDGNYELVCTTNNIFYGVRFWILDVVYDNTRLLAYDGIIGQRRRDDNERYQNNIFFSFSHRGDRSMNICWLSCNQIGSNNVIRDDHCCLILFLLYKIWIFSVQWAQNAAARKAFQALVQA